MTNEKRMMPTFAWAPAKPSVLKKPRTRISQHFLVDPATLIEIAEATSPEPGVGVLEIGAGTGNLTHYLRQAYDLVLAVEMDERLVLSSQRRFSGQDNARVVQGDILKLDVSGLLRKEALEIVRWRVVSNLPYHITTPVLFKLLDGPTHFEAIHILIQDELAQRVASPPGRKAFSPLSVACQLRARCERRFLVPPAVFNPPPKVNSALLSMYPYENPPFELKKSELFSRIVEAGFSQRRKKFINAVLGWRELIEEGLEKEGLNGKNAARLDGALLGAIMRNCGIDVEVRAEAISIEQYILLSEEMARALE